MGNWRRLSQRIPTYVGKSFTFVSLVNLCRFRRGRGRYIIAPFLVSFVSFVARAVVVAG